MHPVPQDEVPASIARQERIAQNGETDVRHAPSITVVVCTRDRLLLLEKCLDALRRQTYPCFDILVVDNGTAQPANELCVRLGVGWIAAPVPGLTRARNIGAQAAGGELVAYIDDDSVVESGWLETLVAGFNTPHTAAVSGRVRYMYALPESRGMSGEESAYSCVRAAAAFDRRTPGWFALACFGGIGDGGNMAFRRAALIEGPGFDERIGRGRLLDSGDEHVLFARFIDRGLRIVHVPEAIVRHPSPPTHALQTERRYSDLRSSISHLLFVWGAFPAHRGEVLRFLLRAVGRRLLPRTTPGAARSSVILPRRLALKAMLGGVRVYWKARAQWRAGGEVGVPGHRMPAPAFMESTPTGSR